MGGWRVAGAACLTRRSEAPHALLYMFAAELAHGVHGPSWPLAGQANLLRQGASEKTIAAPVPGWGGDGRIQTKQV